MRASLSPLEPRIEEVDPGGDEAQWCLSEYYAELQAQFEEGFDASKSVAPDPGEFRRPSGVFLIAFVEGRPVGCGGVKLTSTRVGYIKRMWVESSSRGLGLGRSILKALEDTARGMGCEVVQLETNQALTEAIALYRSSGYREIQPFNEEYYAHHWFEKELRATRPRAP